VKYRKTQKSGASEATKWIACFRFITPPTRSVGDMPGMRQCRKMGGAIACAEWYTRDTNGQRENTRGSEYTKSRYLRVFASSCYAFVETQELKHSLAAHDDRPAI
jgi:hypothetical protein